MEDELEQLDWGNEDDEQQAAQQRTSADGQDTCREPEDAEAEDAVSLGGDDDDMQEYWAFQPAEQGNAKGQMSPTRSSSLSQSQKREHHRESSGGSQKQPPQSHPSDSPNLRRTQSHGKLTHALPPKPMLSVAPFVHPSPAQASTLASSMVQRERRSNGLGKSGSGADDALPPDWEVRYPRNGGRDAYYYNVKTHESTWTQPGIVSGRSSPSKDRENGTTPAREGRSPGPLGVEVSARFDSVEKVLPSRHDRKDANRKASPSGALSYEDRHYRPGGSTHQPTNVDSSERKDERGVYGASPYAEAPYSMPRAPSPRPMDERQRSRSLSPGRHHYPPERPTRARREVTPPRPPVDHGMWREGHREIAPTRHLPDRERNLPRQSSFESPLIQIPDNRPRGRPQQVDLDSPSIRHSRDEWPASRNRSPPPHMHDSALNLRRFPEGPALTHPPAMAPPLSNTGLRSKSRFDRPVNMPPSARPLPGERDVYPPTETVPQRRSRDAELTDAAPNFEPKRRRVDDHDAGFPLHRPSDAGAFHVSGLPERPVQPQFSSPAPTPPRVKKRQPLPPQSTRFAEASRPSALPPPLSIPEPPQGGVSYPSPRQPYDGGAPRRYTDVSSEMLPPPRRPPPMHPPRDIEPEASLRAPSSRPPGRQSSRFDNPATVPREPRDFVAPLDRVPADVDNAHARMSNLRLQDSRANMGMYADRLGADAQMDAPPRGPRAMSFAVGKNAASCPLPSPPPAVSPKTSYSNLRPMLAQVPAPAPIRYNTRFSQPLPQQPVVAGNEGWGERRERQDAPARYPKGPANRESQPRRFDEPKNAGPPPPSRPPRVQDVVEPSHQDMQAQERARYPRRSAGGPPLPLPVSGTNSVPIGNRNVLPERPVERLPPRPSFERDRPSTASNGDFARGRQPQGSAPSDEYDERGDRYHPDSLSPASHYRAFHAAPDVPRRRPSITSDARSNVVVQERPLPPAAEVYQNATVPTRPRRDVRNAEGRRVSRFGPQTTSTAQMPPSPVIPEQERPRIPREPSIDIQSRLRDQPEDFRPSPSVPQARAEPLWEPPRREEPVGPGRRYNEGGNLSGGFETSTRPNVTSPHKRPQEMTPDRGKERFSPVEARARGPPTSLEGRLGSHYDEQYADARYAPGHESAPPPSLPARPSERDAYPEPRPRGPYNDSRDHPPHYREEPPLRWERPLPEKAPEQLPPSAARLHPDRARLIDTAPPTAEDVPLRMSKPVRIRRPPPLSAQSSQETFSPSVPPSSREPPPNSDKRGVELTEPQTEHGPRPTASRRGGSLLDRLSMDQPSSGPADVASPSLRERVESLPKRPDDNMVDVLPGVMDVDYVMDMDYETTGGGNGHGHGGGEYGFRGMSRGGKRRGMKPKRGGRRGGVPS